MTNDHSLKRPSDAEPEHGLLLNVNIVLVVRVWVVGHYQAEWDVDHRHLNAEFQADRRAAVLRQSPFITLRSANDVEGLRLALKEDLIEANGVPGFVFLGVVDIRLSRQEARRVDYHAAIQTDHSAGGT